MAEQQEIPEAENLEDVVECNDDDEEAMETPGYKPPAQKTLDEIKKLDADDESLVRYKETLLAGANKVKDEGGPNVLVQKLNIIMADAPTMELDLTGDLSKFKKTPFVFKEKATYKVKITFRVQREIVCGLRFLQQYYRMKKKVDSMKLMVGSYGPREDPYEYLTPEEEVPSGMLARGSYVAKSQVTDDDKNVLLEWEWAFDIKKDFK